MQGGQRHVSIVLATALLLSAHTVAAQTAPAPRCGTGVHEEEAVGAVLFPQDQIFCPTIEDPKEPCSFISFLRGTFRSLDDPSGEGTSIARRGGRQFRPGAVGRA